MGTRARSKTTSRLPVPSAAVKLARGAGAPTLPRYEEARRALEALHNTDDIAVVRDKAVALEEYAKIIKDPELLERAISIKLEAWRNIGRVLHDMRKAGELHTSHSGRTASLPGSQKKKTLADQGISQKKGAAAEKLRALSERQFWQPATAARLTCRLGGARRSPSGRIRAKTDRRRLRIDPPQWLR